MSTRTSLRPTKVITKGDMSGNITSLPTILQSISGVSYSFSWTGSSSLGVLNVQVSNDYALNPNGTVENAGTWNTVYLDVAGSASTDVPISGNSGNGVIDPIQTDAYAIRLIYVVTSGTGTLTAYINGKVS